MATAVIAAARYPLKKDAPAFFERLKELEPSVQGIHVTYGVGCINIGVSFKGDIPEEFMNRLVYSMQPARWAKASDKDWEGIKYDLPE